ncbi:unnamed protein product [Schistosoma intercalatum]|nr:unnamed protein product [Schistosoma intercalatum]
MNRIILSQHKITLHSSRHILTKISRSYQFNKNSRSSGFSQPPGYIPPHIWMKSRPGREDLKTSIFGVDEKKPTVDEKSYLSHAAHASLSGFPVTENFSYEIVNNINEIPKVDQKLLNNLQAMGLFELTPVQKHAIGIMSVDEYEEVDVKIDESNQSTDDNPPYERVTGKFDLMAAAQTGSGKTLAYLIPIFNRLLRVYPFEAMQSLLISRTRRQYPSSVILVPTRELVQQIQLELRKLCNQTFVRSVGVFGGERPERQMFELNKGCHFVVATPGRLLDFLNRDCISLKFCRSLILDEADRMLDMGFEEQIRQILESPKFQMPPPTGNGRQTALFSATYPREVALLAKDFLRGPNCISLTLSSPESNTGTVVPTWGKAVRNKNEDEFERLTRIIPKEINQQFQVVVGNPESAVSNHLLQLILEMKSKSLESVCRVLVFCNTKREVDQIDNYLYSNGIKSTSIHGDKTQSSRAKSLDLFRKGTANVLVASSVAARGIDIPNVFAVINIGLPNELDDYVHRIGRTGRMGKSGEAITLIHETLLQQQQSSRTVSRGICQLFESVGNLDKVPKLLLEYANMETQEGGEQKYNIRSKNKDIYSKFKPRSFTKGYKSYSRDDSSMRYL